MRLARYATPEGSTVGLLLDDRLVDLGVADIAELYQGDGLLERRVEVALSRWAGGRGSDASPAVADAEILPPIQWPTKVIGVGMNYHSFVKQIGEDIPAYPVLFHKTASALTGHGHAIEIPPITSQAVPEGEVAVVIGRAGRDIAVHDALKFVAGYCCANDVSARNLEFRTSQWTSGKMLPTFCPLGPWLTTADEVDPAELVVETTRNGSVIQRGATRDMVFSVPQLVSEISALVSLEVGDVILTGTPSDLGEAEPPVFLAPGDIIGVTIDGLGTLQNPVTLRGER